MCISQYSDVKRIKGYLKKTKRKLFQTARVGPRTTVLRSRLVIDFATTANIEEFVKLIIFTAFVHEILPVDAV